MNNQALPFLVHETDISGRLVQLTDVAQDIASRRTLPIPVQGLLAEAVAIAGAMRSLLQFQGKLIIQAKGKGPVSMLVAQATPDGGLRATANVDEKRLKAYGKIPSFYALLGEGYVAFSLDRGSDFDLTQGIVELQKEGLAASLQHYFDQSDQISLRLISAAKFRDTGWVSGAIAIQRLPLIGGEGATDSAASGQTYGERTGAKIGHEEIAKDMWDEVLTLFNTTKASELTDPNLSGQQLLYRLFHEQGVRVAEPEGLTRFCVCDKERFVIALQSLNEADLSEVFTDGQASSTCEFCGTTYTASREELASFARSAI